MNNVDATTLFLGYLITIMAMVGSIVGVLCWFENCGLRNENRAIRDRLLWVERVLGIEEDTDESDR